MWMTSSLSSELYAKLCRWNGNACGPRVFNPTGFGIGLAQPESGRCAIRFATSRPALTLTRRTGELHEQVHEDFDAGIILCGAGRSARRQQGLRRARQRSAARRQQQEKEEIERAAPRLRADRVRGRLSRRLCRDLRPRRIYLRHRAVEDAWPRRQRGGRQSDRLLLPQARRLQGLADLVRARAEGRPEPRQDLAILWSVAG